MDHIVESLRSLAVDIDTINEDTKNARTHDSRNLETIKNSLVRFGQRIPLVVQRQGMVIRAGNGRYQVAKELGWNQIAVVVVDEKDVDATAFALMDNRSSELASWDNTALADILDGLNTEVGDLENLGFSEGYLDAISDNWKVDGIDLSEQEDYSPDQETFVIKVEKVRAGDKDSVLKVINDAIEELGYEANAY